MFFPYEEKVRGCIFRFLLYLCSVLCGFPISFTLHYIPHPKVSPQALEAAKYLLPAEALEGLGPLAPLDTSGNLGVINALISELLETAEDGNM
jgi:hypothetical protein